MICPRFTISILAASLALTACEPSPVVERAHTDVEPAQIEKVRFTITTLSEFPDDLAYGGKCRIYEIKDGKTGVSYIGVTGLGLDRMKRDEDVADAIQDIADGLSDIGD